MADHPEKSSGSSIGQDEVRGAIHAFEQILEIMPNDLACLESVWRAYAELGDDRKSLDILLRLTDALAEQNDTDTAQRILEALPGAAYTDPRVHEIEATLNAICSETAPSEHMAPTVNLRESINVSDELSFAWYLLENNLLDQDEYAQVANILAELSTQEEKGTISVLHALETQSFPRMDRLIETVANDLATPYVDTTSFDIGMDLARKLPLRFMIGRGVLPFESMESMDILIAVMNPSDKGLREEIVQALGLRCHFFLTAPRCFDDSMRTLVQRLAEAERLTS